jgi:hypothetical protein
VNETSQTYENRDIGIRYLYPSHWGDLTNQNGCINYPCGIPIDSKSATIGGLLMIMKLYNNTEGFECNCNSLTEFVKMMYGKVSSEDGFSFINDNQTTVGKKYPAWQFEYSALNADGLPATKLIISTKVNDTFYAIAYNPSTENARAKQLPELRKLVGFIEFLPIQNQVTKTPSFMNMNETGESIPETSIDNNLHGLQILSHNSFTDSAGYMHVVGEIKNNYPSAATFVKIIGTFYDINDRVVATDVTYTNPSDIAPGDKAPFELILTSASVPTSLIDHYSLRATYQ